MGIVISDGVVLGRLQVFDPQRPRLCWQTVITQTSVSATSEEEFSPASNLGIPSTAYGWAATSTDEQTITVQVGTQIDYIGIARHNLSGTAEIRIRVQVGASIFVLFDWDTVPNSQVLLYLIQQAEPDQLLFDIRNNATPPRIAVIYAGIATMLQRNIYVGHTPITYGRNVATIGGYSENGQYLGELVRREGRSTSVQMQNLTPDYYRDTLDPFIRQRPRRPAFFSWRPGSYESEVGYVWLTGNPQPSNQRPNGMMEITLNFEGIA